MKIALRPCGSYHRLGAKCPKCEALPPERRVKERRQPGRKPLNHRGTS